MTGEIADIIIHNIEVPGYKRNNMYSNYNNYKNKKDRSKSRDRSSNRSLDSSSSRKYLPLMTSDEIKKAKKQKIKLETIRKSDLKPNLHIRDARNLRSNFLKSTVANEKRIESTKQQQKQIMLNSYNSPSNFKVGTPKKGDYQNYKQLVDPKVNNPIKPFNLAAQYIHNSASPSKEKANMKQSRKKYEKKTRNCNEKANS